MGDVELFGTLAGTVVYDSGGGVCACGTVCDQRKYECAGELGVGVFVAGS